jgi:hypothetical protein
MLPPKKKPPSGAATLNQVRQLRLVSRSALSTIATPPEPLHIANDGTEGVLLNSHGVVM